MPLKTPVGLPEEVVARDYVSELYGIKRNVNTFDFFYTDAINIPMNALTTIIVLVVLSLAAPFALHLHRHRLVWITLAIVNLIIIALYIIVRDTWQPELAMQ